MGQLLEIVDALKIISSLANGKHPDTNEPLPPDSLFQSPNVIRALYSASSALEIQKRRRPRQPAANAGQPWLDEEDSRLVAQYKGGVTDLGELARLHERSEASIESRLIRHGLLEPRRSIITARGRRRASNRATPTSDQNFDKEDGQTT
jgi:hypothetical protein